MTGFSGHNLTCARGNGIVFKGLSFALRPGQILAVTGSNGAGKTSLLRIMAGLLRPASGTIDAPPALHWVGTDNALKADLTIAENLAFWSCDQNAITAAIAKLGLADVADRPVRALSAGQKRRAALARLFLEQRPLWILDEPSSFLDAENAARLYMLAREHADAGGMVVLATHDAAFWHPDDVLELAS